MEIKVLKLGTVCTDRATKLKGTLTHWSLDMGGGTCYLFQPKGLDENMQPVKKIALELARLEVQETDFEMVMVPFEILGSIVENKPSGFKGMAVEFVRHVNGCFHVVIQPEGILPRTKLPIQKCEFDLRECTGKKIVELTAKELAQSKEKAPSPTGDVFPSRFSSTM